MQNLYRHFDSSNRLLYVGISLNAINRLSQHNKNSHWADEISHVEIEKFETRQEAIRAETKAFDNESPAYNIYRPTAKENLQTEKRAEISKQDLVKRIVQFNPVYSFEEVAQLLKIGVQKLHGFCDDGLIGFVVTSRYFNPKYNKEVVSRKFTGWQLIDFIENWENGLDSNEENSSNK
tara:strand:- start:137 stop:670 length:534 start_codon:yes stop_codon:yes gene_type:complete